MTTSFSEHDAGCSPAEHHPPAAALDGAAKAYRAGPDAIRTLDGAGRPGQLSGRIHSLTDGGVS